MTTPIPESHLDILENKSLAHLATLMPDGRPQVTPVWCDFDGADARIVQLAHKYLGVNEYPHRRGEEVRVIYKIAPQRFTRMG